jgi:uncharacterized protein YkwD
MSAEELEVLRLTNVARAAAGCPALKANSVLAGVASRLSKDMADNGFFSHTSPSSGTLSDRINASGYAWRQIAENIAAGNDTPAATMNQWMNSEGHRKNIETCGLTEMGVGVYRKAGSPYRVYWTQTFGTPR